VKHFATEWVIPSSRNLPAFAVASVVLHLALEGMRKSSQAGTKDNLQQLSSSVIVVVLLPTFSDAITESSSENGNMSQHEESARTATMCLRALKAWCTATYLSLPQINHICSKTSVSTIPRNSTQCLSYISPPEASHLYAFRSMLLRSSAIRCIPILTT
jgi:hypothetical protein